MRWDNPEIPHEHSKGKWNPSDSKSEIIIHLMPTNTRAAMHVEIRASKDEFSWIMVSLLKPDFIPL